MAEAKAVGSWFAAAATTVTVTVAEATVVPTVTVHLNVSVPALDGAVKDALPQLEAPLSVLSVTVVPASWVHSTRSDVETPPPEAVQPSWTVSPVSAVVGSACAPTTRGSWAFAVPAKGEESENAENRERIAIRINIRGGGGTRPPPEIERRVGAVMWGLLLGISVSPSLSKYRY